MNSSRLTGVLEYKSKTTISRVLNGQYTYNGCQKIYASMEEKTLLTEDWKERFQQALKVEQNGKMEYELMMSIRDMLKGEPPAIIVQDVYPVCLSDLLIVGCPWNETSRLIQAAIEANRKVRIMHFLTDREIATHSAVIPLLMAHMLDFQYQAVEIPEKQLSAGMTRHFAIGKEKNTGNEYILTAVGNQLNWNRIDHMLRLFDVTMKELSSIDGVLLYRNEQLRSGTDYIHFMQESYRMEQDHGAVIFKPALGIQMLPTKLLVDAYNDYMKDSMDPVYACSTTLIYLLKKRADNFRNRSHPTELFLSYASMEEFAKTGVLADQFYGTRPYTPSERKNILSDLVSLIKEKQVDVCLLKWKKEMAFSCEAYENVGTLVYPGRTNYNSESGEYRELFIPAKTHYMFFKRFAEELKSCADCLSVEETEKTLTKFSRLIM